MDFKGSVIAPHFNSLEVLQGTQMYLFAAIPFALAAIWLVVVVYRLAKLNARLRANLAGCTGYPISKSFRRPDSLPVPLRAGHSRAAERARGRA